MKVARSPFAMVPLWVYDHPSVTPTVLHVYISLAAAAHDRKTSRSIPTIMARTGLGKTAVYAALATLNRAGATTERRDGSLFLPLDEPEMSDSAVAESSVDTEPDSATAENLSAHTENLSATAESSFSIEASRGSSRDTPLPPTPLLALRTPFDAFWRTYPRRTARGAAETAWAKAVAFAPPEVIIEAAGRYRDDPNREDAFTAHPATWLNQRRWLDDPLPSRTNGNGSVGDRSLRVLKTMQARRNGHEALTSGRLV